MSHGGLLRRVAKRMIPDIAFSAGRALKSLELTYRYAEDDLARLHRLNHLFRYIAKTNHPLHRFYMTQGFGKNPIQLESLRNLQQVTPIDKSLLKEWLAEGVLYNNLPIGSVFGQTSGSTGQPFTTAVDPRTMRVRSLVETKFQSQANFRPGSRELRIWRKKVLSRDCHEAVARGELSYFFVDESNNEADKPVDINAKLIRWIHQFRPKIIKGYAGVIAGLARHIREEKVDLADLELVLPVAEYLSRSEWLDCEKTFGCPVVNLYGGTETPAIAQSLGSNDVFRVARSLYCLEAKSIQNHSESDGAREIFITDLNNSAMPLIRYKNGDLCLIDSNKNSFDIDSFNEVIGRKNDIITLPDKSCISPHVWFVAFRNFNWLGHFEIHQNYQGFLDIKYSVLEGAPPLAMAEMQKVASSLCRGYLTSISRVTKHRGLGSIKRKVITTDYSVKPSS